MTNDEQKKDESIVRLEERTRALERCDRRHYVIEMVLFAAVLALLVMAASSCTIQTPERIDSREWVYREEVAKSGLAFFVNTDGESVTARAGGRDYVIVKNDVTDIVPLNLSVRISVEREKITIIDHSSGLTIGYFEYR